MIEYDESARGELQLDSDLGVKVIGVGGAGANVLDRMALEGSDVAELLALNTDVRALKNSVSSEKIQLGSTLLKGMGTGGDPELGKQAALEAVDSIREAVRGAGMVFVCVGLGGGTGSGAAPEVCRIAKEEGVFLAVFATMPFSFEGQRRMDQAKLALSTIGQYANAVITFDNDRMGELIVPKDGVTQAFAAADKIISQSIRATMNVVFRPGIIHIGMDDLLAAIRTKDSRCLFGYGLSKGDNRSLEAVEQALKCPLLDRGKLLNEAQAVLVQVSGGDNMTLYEVQLVMEEVRKHVGENTQILFGTGTDKRLGSALSVTLISSIPGPGVEGAEIPASAAAASAPVSLSSAAPAGGAPSIRLSQAESAPPLPSAEADVPAPLRGRELSQQAEEGEDETLVFESLDDAPEVETVPEEEVPSYAPDSIPPALEDAEEATETVVSDERNPIARAIEDSQVADTGSIAPIQPADLGIEQLDEDEAPGAGHVEALTESSQKITLTRVVSGSGNTGRIKTRSPGDGGSNGPVMPPTKPPAMPAEELDDGEIPDEVKQQQELLQLEPVKAKGRFAKTDPTIVDGEDLDVPTFLRKKK
ncbi:MAG: cell division protein FtsZ [Verrucomicrobiales bacterium]|nr:cell division protein FtsZ [Verrucomicrobiales bacterium]